MATLTVLTDTKVSSLKPAAIRQEFGDALVPGLRLRVGSTGKKTWIVRARSGKKMLTKTLGHYPKVGVGAARKAAGKALELIAEGSGDHLDLTFGQVASRWIERVAEPKNASWKLQDRRLEIHVLPKWRDKKIRQIKKSDVRDLLENIEGGSLPNMVLALVRPIFRYALSHDWIEVDPTAGVKKPTTDQARDRVLAMDEVARIWRASEFLGYPFQQYVRLLLLLAQRRSEVASMRWDAVDLKAKTWTLQAGETKANRAHLVPLPDPAVAILKAMPRFGPFVFSTDGETSVSGFSKMKRRLDAFIAANGEPLEPYVIHDFRRSAATHMVRLGVLMEIVGRVLNHAVTGVTAKVYALHEYEPEKRAALNKWAAEVVKALGKAS